MRYLTILLAVFMLTSCSWSWPWQWGDADTGNCLDNDTCDEANPFEEQLVGGTWYCYGKSKDEPWDCGQNEDSAKISAVTGSEAQESAPLVTERIARAELAMTGETVSATTSTTATAPETAVQDNSALAGYSDDSFAVQLIAVQTIQEIDRFAERYGLESPSYLLINTQGDNWYVVLLGIFDDKASADAAADAWNETNRPFSKPWVRPVGPLKAAAQLAEPAGA